MRKSGTVILYTGLFLFACMLAALLMMSDALRDSSQFSRLYSGLLIFTTLGLCSLVTLIFLNLRHLIQQRRNQIPGTRMTVRMIAMFTALSVTPVLVVYLFSLDFLHRGIDSWFDLRVEQALDDSLKLSKLSLDTRMRELLKQTNQMAKETSGISDAEMPFEIDELRTRTNAKEVTLMNRQGGVITSSSENTESVIPDRPSDTILLQLQQGGSYTGLDNTIRSGLHIRVVVNVTDINVVNNSRMIQALYPVSEEINTLTNSIQTSYIKYKELSYLREQLKLSFILVLTLVLLFSLFATVWTAFYFSKRHVAPIRDMAEGTRAIADGDYHTQIPIPSNDELGFLVASFNEMTQKIAQARDAAGHSQLKAETQQAYLEAVLGRLSSGVLVFDKNKILRTSNISAGKILGIPINSVTGESLENICLKYQHLEPMQKTILSHDNTEQDWREQITLFGKSGRQILMCSGTPHSITQDENEGYIIVFDDITELLQGQKNAAWSEMARRLAHEIKNPLTPIQLAAERLRHKYLHTMDQKDADTLDRLTNTIVQQVETMKDMVNTFSDYARPPETKTQAMDINTLIKEVLDLFTNLDQKTEIELNLETHLPMVNADVSRLRQVFNNLLKNAFDACEEITDSTLTITSQCISTAGTEYVEILISDSGPGISEDIMEHIFEPYVTTKTKGTGLGLAIVKKIIEEHNGVVWLENNKNKAGVSAIIRLPIMQKQDDNTHSNNTNGKTGMTS
ncbi:MAG: two-component sensor histidine kinase [Gammaproteobacteria bacterium]|nr:MAG: two-component sensor histidine kinase [Gammaproteobacteria bacterium]